MSGDPKTQLSANSSDIQIWKWRFSISIYQVLMAWILFPLVGNYPKFGCRAQWEGGKRPPFPGPLPLSLCNEGLSHKWEHDAVLTNTELGALFNAREHKINLEVWRNEAKADTQVPTIFTTWPCIACSETSIHETIAFCTFNVVSWWMRATSKCHPSLWASQLFSALFIQFEKFSWESLHHYTSIIHWLS